MPNSAVGAALVLGGEANLKSRLETVFEWCFCFERTGGIG